MHRNAAAQIRQGKCRDPIAAVDRSEQGKQRRVLGNLLDLPVGLRPADRREIRGEQLYLAEECLAHELLRPPASRATGLNIAASPRLASVIPFGAAFSFIVR